MQFHYGIKYQSNYKGVIYITFTHSVDKTV